MRMVRLFLHRRGKALRSLTSCRTSEKGREKDGGCLVGVLPVRVAIRGHQICEHSVRLKGRVFQIQINGKGELQRELNGRQIFKREQRFNDDYMIIQIFILRLGTRRVPDK